MITLFNLNCNSYCTVVSVYLVSQYDKITSSNYKKSVTKKGTLHGMLVFGLLIISASLDLQRVLGSSPTYW